MRDQVRLLLTMERNRTFTKIIQKIIHCFTLVFVDAPHEDQLAITQLKHEYLLLARAIDKNVTLESAMHEINHEVLSSADQLVKADFAQWKPQMDLEHAEEVLRNWRTVKFVGTMFRNKPRPE